MRRTRIKVCGITSQDQARWAVDLGIDAIGLVFVPESPRFISMQQAVGICGVPAGLTLRVGLFMNAPQSKVQEVLARVDLDVLQFHGGESENYCESFERPYIKAVSSDLPQSTWIRSHPQARALLLDSHSTGEQGGTGKAFDWGRFPGDSGRLLILAGGLRPENVAEAVRQTNPHGVDTSSGVESRPGIKDPAKMEHFVSEVRRADSS